MKRLACVLALSWSAAPACAPVAADQITPLDPRGQLMRASMDLRGTRPTEDELVIIEEQPELYPAFVDLWLQTPAFEERLRSVWNLRFLTRTGELAFDPTEADIEGVDARSIAASLADEPLRLLSWIARHDRPLTELVTADYTVADQAVARMWDVEIPGFGGWEPGRYADGRPHAGVLSMTTLWQRYPSAGGNANRHRANAVSRLLLCDDYLDRPIAFARSDVDAVASDPEETIRDTPACQSCHATLDPLAAHFFGFWGDEEGLREATLYRPERELLWMEHGGAAPAYYGTPTSNLVELGTQIAEDPRFVDCAVRTAVEGFTQRSLGPADWSEVQALRLAFEEGGLTLRALVRAIVTSETYLAGDAADADLRDRLATVRRVSPDQLAGVVEGLTGFRWTIDGRDALTDPDVGLITLAGGVAGDVTAPSWSPSVTLSLLHERLAWLAAWHVVRRDLVEGEQLLLQRVTLDTHPDTHASEFAATVRDLLHAVRGRRLEPDSPEPARFAALFAQVYSVEGDPEAAWAAVVSAALRDPAVLFY